MGDLINELRQDHYNMAKLLKILEAELEPISADEALPDLSIMSDIMRYMTHYADVVHHPREDALFDLLKQKSEDAADAIRTLRVEHEQLETMGAEFRDMVYAAADGHMIKRDVFENLGRNYISVLFRHMNFEETELLPKARELMDENDLSAAKAAVEAGHDPLFGELVENDYRALLDFILQQDAAK